MQNPVAGLAAGGRLHRGGMLVGWRLDPRSGLAWKGGRGRGLVCSLLSLQPWPGSFQAEPFWAWYLIYHLLTRERPLLPRTSLGFQGDLGGLRTLQKKWTSFLKARLICSRPESNLIFNVLQDIFVLRSPDLKEPVFYGVFTPQL